MTSKDLNKFYDEHGDIIFEYVESGMLTDDDFNTLANEKHEYTFDERQAVFNKLKDAIKSENIKENEFAGTDFGKMLDDVESLSDTFEPNEDDWLSYDNKQMAKLAEKLKYDWENDEDRSAMMQRLQDKAIRQEKVKAYEESKKNSPVRTFVTEMMAPNVTTRLSRGEEIKGRDYVLDALNAGAMLMPSVGGRKTAAALLGTDIGQSVATGFNTGAIDKDFWNDKADLAMAVGFPSVGQAASKSTELLKKTGDILKGTLEASQVGGKVLDNVADPILDALEDTKSVARNQAKRDMIVYEKYRADLLKRLGFRGGSNTNIVKRIDKEMQNPEFRKAFDKYTSETGAAPYDREELMKLYEQYNVAKNALGYLDNKPWFSGIPDEQRNQAGEYLKGLGMKSRGNRGKEVVQSISKPLSKPIIEGPVEKYVYRDDAIEEKNDRIIKAGEDLYRNKAGQVYNFYKGQPHDLTDEEIQVLRMWENLR